VLLLMGEFVERLYWPRSAAEILFPGDPRAMTTESQH
jgi:hypothetical protein